MLFRSLGDAMVRDLDRQYCHTPAGDAALRALAAKMGAGVAVRSVEVADFPLVNAITLPGGRIIIFDGLLQQAQSADEVAGVLGHEMGHVEHRDTLKAMIRQMGLKVVMGGFDGKVGNYVNGVLNLSYSRSAESEADQASVVSLKRANINPSDTAAFFTRLEIGRAHV